MTTTQIVEQIKQEWEFLTATEIDRAKHTGQLHDITVPIKDSLYHLEITSSTLDKATNDLHTTTQTISKVSEQTDHISSLAESAKMLMKT